MTIHDNIKRVAELLDSKGKPNAPITCVSSREYLRKEFKAATRGGR